MPSFPDSSSYIQSLTQSQRSNNSSLASVLQAVGVKCSPCMQGKLRSLASFDQRKQYYSALKMTEEQINQAEAALNK